MDTRVPRPEGFSRTEIRGDAGIDLSEPLREADLLERAFEIECASGGRSAGRWRGVPIADLLAGSDPRATHLLAEAEDGYRACVPVLDALEGILAVERLDADSEALPRIVAPDVDAARLVKRVVRLETVRLGPGVDPTELERLDPGGGEW